ncbi:hypothetical protein WR25_16619 isoform M [Diploscapter pachys]|uniref:Mitochondrial import receptor subunit TOM70 n=1 Tax=Diploscapter pachys TaxID=2018661 RepID=A0A2A2L5E7_9BILA|nr:hypothetical protein WR25_16619 isoform B [Diploscapter pachys]PAV81485.1 hypothetical protein WR25_16619 isoform C [Diploscapter pachys]PAV81486.1 hypothetical protein WR25_16619 isoform D [Diploscapter pachys]PAV81487.1 hypothetical protein WR25_16619 isoform E [Diploscapter pachys]PAV81488.1 hypothetical protein WR25_16619 isoform F [Diploscapter pachys]
MNSANSDGGLRINFTRTKFVALRFKTVFFGFSEQMSSSSSDNATWLRRAALVGVAGVASAGVLYYILNRGRTAGSKKAADGGKALKADLNSLHKLSVQQLKELGNKCFSTKDYDDAIKVFSAAIERKEKGAESLIAICYQNRAASKEKAGSYTAEEIIEDCSNALKFNPSYAKAYFRRARYNEKAKNYQEGLVDVFCAVHLDEKLEQQGAQVMMALMEEIEKSRRKEWTESHKNKQGQRMPIRHEKVYAWLWKTVVNDALRNDILNFSGTPDSDYKKALQLVREKQFDAVCDVAEREEGDDRMPALLLAARFYGYANQPNKAEKQKELVKWRASKHLVLIELARNKEKILESVVSLAYLAAISSDLYNADFYAITAFRLVMYGEAHEAMKILQTTGVSEMPNLKLLRYTLEILANTDGNMVYSDLHNSIVQLEQFVLSLPNKTAYPISLLAKIYATFGNPEAIKYYDDVLKLEPNESVHLFDRSCIANNAEESLVYLEKCLALEPNHAEANLMCASLKMNEIGNKLTDFTRAKYDEMSAYMDRAEQTFEDTIDFPIVHGVFRLRAILDAKLEAASLFGII